MSNIKEYTLVAGGAADTDAFALAQNTTAGTALTLTAAATGATLLATPREVTLTSAANFSAVTFTVVGVDRWGNTITEDITGPNNNTVAGRKVYRSITSITPNGSVASNVEAGYPQRVCSPWVLIPFLAGGRDNVPTGIVASEIVSGSPDLSVEVTDDDFWNVSGEGAYVQSSTDTTPPAATDVRGVGARAVNTAASGTIKARFVRPRI